MSSVQTQTYTSAEDFAWCKSMLPKVSRTFALVISVLTGEKYKSILLAYLLCRIADTIEDNVFLPAEKKYQILEDFISSLKSGQPADSISHAFSGHKTDDPDSDLTFQADRVIRVFYTLPPETRDCIVPWVEEMVRGMKKFQAFSTPSETITAVKSVQELEEYCYFVAGTVGIMLTRLFIRFSPSISVENQEKMNRLAVSFGVGLQLTNILKDFNEDLRRGWCYLPADLLQKHGISPEEIKNNPDDKRVAAVVEDLRQIAHSHLKNALDYTFAIPRLERQIRLFCLWPLHMANQTLAAITRKSGLFSGGTVKISRKQVKQTVFRTQFDWFSNNRQLLLFNSYPYQSLQ